MKQIFQFAQILGTRRVILLTVLIVANAVLAGGLYLYLMPRAETLQAQLQQLSGQVASKRSAAQTLGSEYGAIQDQKMFFGQLKDAGFFADQNRTMIRGRIGDIQKFSNVLSAKYSVAAATVEHTQAADDAGYVLLDSPITVEVDALDDTDFYTFVYCLENAFPGHVTVDSLTVSRIQELTEPVLKQIGGGVSVPVVRGIVTVSWRTMVPATQVGGASPDAPKG